MCIGTSFVCVVCQPTLFSALGAPCSCAFFLGLYGPLYDASRIHPRWWTPQSLYGTLSRPTVQSTRGSTGLMLPARKFWPRQAFADAVSDGGGDGSSGGLFHALLVIATGRPAASTWKKFTRLNDG